MDFQILDSFAGFAALVNGLILWPLVRSLKKDHGERISRLESRSSRTAPEARRAATSRRNRPRKNR